MSELAGPAVGISNITCSMLYAIAVLWYIPPAAGLTFAKLWQPIWLVRHPGIQQVLH